MRRLHARMTVGGTDRLGPIEGSPDYSTTKDEVTMLRTSMTVCCVGAVYGVVLAMTSTAAHGQCEVTETAEITASDGLFGDEFGRSVAISGNTMIVGAPTADAAGDAAGAAYIYMFDGV